MNNIGILTFWGVPNYGAWAQSYALNKVVGEMLTDKDVRHIAYLDTFHHDAYYEGKRELEKSFEYSWDIIPHTNMLDCNQLEKEHFDLVITGSDTIWEFSTKYTNDDVHLIGNNLNADHIIAYAASAGMSCGANKHKDYVKEGLCKYDYISVRDNNTKKMVRDIIEKDACVVVDPTMLYDFKNDELIPNVDLHNYIFVYGLVWGTEYIEQLKKFAKSRGLTLVSGGYVNDWCDINIGLSELKASEWAGMIKNATYVASSMFHGLMMSLAFEKVIFFYQHDIIKSKSTSLLTEIGIPYYSSDDNSRLEKIEEEFDYIHINKKLNEKRQYSYNILKKMLEVLC